MKADRKKAIIIGGAAAAVLGGLLFATFVLFKSKQEEPVSPGIPVGEPAETLVSLVTWEDPAGFSFDYPGNLTTDSHEEDEKNYAHLELADDDHPGSIIIWMKDTTYKTIDNWAEKESEAVSEQIFDTTLGGHEAKKIIFTDGRILTAALDQEVIVLIEILPGDVSFWQPVYDQIVSSFEFIPLAAAESKPPATTGGGASEIWEEEEVIE